METEVKINLQTAETMYISHPEASYGIFCYNSMGDLFLNSDWGFFAFAWRAYGADFKAFLAQTNSDYIMCKFEMNYRQVYSKKLNKAQSANVKTLVDVLISELKKQIQSTKTI